MPLMYSKTLEANALNPFALVAITEMALKHTNHTTKLYCPLLDTSSKEGHVAYIVPNLRKGMLVVHCPGRTPPRTMGYITSSLSICWPISSSLGGSLM